MQDAEKQIANLTAQLVQRDQEIADLKAAAPGESKEKKEALIPTEFPEWS